MGSCTPVEVLNGIAVRFRSHPRRGWDCLYWSPRREGDGWRWEWSGTGSGSTIEAARRYADSLTRWFDCPQTDDEIAAALAAAS